MNSAPHHSFARARRAVAAFTVAALAVSVTTSALATADGPDFLRVVGVASDDVLWIRSGPSARTRKLGAIPFDARGVRNLGCRNRWCRVQYRGVRGWSHIRYLRED